MCMPNLNVSFCQFNDVECDVDDGSLGYVYQSVVYETFLPLLMYILPEFEYHPWVFSILGSTVIGLSGVFPLFIIPIDEGVTLESGAGARTLRILLNFAVGCLLGDVFLHLLPEVWASCKDDGMSHPCLDKGLGVLSGLLIFIVLEKVFSCVSFVPDEGEHKSEESSPVMNGNGCLNNNSTVAHVGNGYPKGVVANGTAGKPKGVVANGMVQEQPKRSTIHVSGYLNLMANSFDNFTHGLAVGGSFLISPSNGLLTTLAILLHEVPHEVGDFAILLRSGFSRWDAAKAQLCTAAAGMVGSLTAIMCSGTSGTVAARTSWILPFTSGGFLHIALVTVLPDLLKEEDPRQSLLQFASLLSGIAVMACLSAITE